MRFDPKNTLTEFNQLMVEIKNVIPGEYDAFIKAKEVITSGGKIPQKTKWLLLLVASVTAKCPVCIAKAVEHCLKAGWTKEEMLETCMIAVLIGGSSVMTYVTLADKAINELGSAQK